MVVRSMGAPTHMEITVYAGQVWNYQAKRFEEIQMTGMSKIGPCQGPNQSTQERLDVILRPMNMDSKSLTWASSSEIDIIMGGDNARLLVQDNPEMNGILKPCNLNFITHQFSNYL